MAENNEIFMDIEIDIVDEEEMEILLDKVSQGVKGDKGDKGDPGDISSSDIATVPETRAMIDDYYGGE